MGSTFVMVAPDAGLDLDFDDSQQAIAGALAEFCRDHCSEEQVKAATGSFPRAIWQGLAELGVLALVTPEGDGGAIELVAALESLGAAVAPGPLVATFFATQVLSEPERIAVGRGEAVVSVGVPPLMPWATVADHFLTLDGNDVFLATPRGEITPLATLGGEPWGGVELERAEPLGSARNGLALADLALAAYLAAAAGRLVAVTAEHARTRKQFGRAIGEFQAVAHPLADGAMASAGAAALARTAAYRFDHEGPRAARSTAAAARLSASRAALDAAYTCHQLFGAQGVTLEGPVFHVSRRIRQLVSQPPGPATSRESVLEPYGV